ncbi:hypothetical protein BOX15_Mlig013517g3, partial [Macrostomum lignano]
SPVSKDSPATAAKALLQSSFRCQRCCVRLNLNATLRGLDREAVQATINTFQSRSVAMADSEQSGDSQQQQQQQQQQQCTTMSASCDSESASHDFLLLDSAPSISQNLSTRLAVFERLFEFLNANCAADHPLCTDCADVLAELQADRVRQLEEELACMRRYLEHLTLAGTDGRNRRFDNDASEVSADPADDADTDHDDEEAALARLEAEEAELRAELESTGAELAEVRAEADAEEAKKSALTAEHQQLQHAYSELKRQLFLLDEELSATRNQQAYAESELNRLQNTSVLGAAFHIWYDAHIASIGGFRMGRPAGGQIDWAELNAGWGQCALLLQAVSHRLGFASTVYTVVPCASQSEMRLLATGRSLPLYSSHGRLFSDSAFDSGMSAYLSCVTELLAFVRDRYGKDRLAPYPLHPPKEIEDSGQRFAIVRAGNKDERWTMALRLMLLDIKMLQAWMSTEPELLQKKRQTSGLA